MGQKVNPIGLRLGINRTWDSRWYAEGEEYATMLHEDISIRKVLRKLYVTSRTQLAGRPRSGLGADGHSLG